jgi:hypothetical protein
MEELTRPRFRLTALLRGLTLIGAFAFLWACAPSTYIAPHVRLVSSNAAQIPPITNPPGERWWRVLLHVHSALNFVWKYDDVRDAIAQEERDRVSAELEVPSRMQHYRPDVVEALLSRVSRRGIDAVVLTEHNTVSHALDPLLPRRRGDTHLFPWATEWTAWRGGGHALLLGVGRAIRPANSSRANADDFVAAVRTARAEGATAIVAHPTTWNSPWRKRLPDDVHGVEVLNSWPTGPRATEALWHESLRRGARFAAVGGADWHAMPPAATPLLGAWRLTEVRAPALDERTIYRAIAKGHTVACEGVPERLPRLRISVAGRCREGDECALEKGSPVRIVVEVRGGAGLSLELYDETSPSLDAPALRLPVVGRRFRVLLERDAPRTGFVRAALRGVDTVAVGSPVYLR